MSWIKSLNADLYYATYNLELHGFCGTEWGSAFDHDYAPAAVVAFYWRLWDLCQSRQTIPPSIDTLNRTKLRAWAPRYAGAFEDMKMLDWTWRQWDAEYILRVRDATGVFLPAHGPHDIAAKTLSQGCPKGALDDPQWFEFLVGLTSPLPLSQLIDNRNHLEARGYPTLKYEWQFAAEEERHLTRQAPRYFTMTEIATKLFSIALLELVDRTTITTWTIHPHLCPWPRAYRFIKYLHGMKIPMKSHVPEITIIIKLLTCWPLEISVQDCRVALKLDLDRHPTFVFAMMVLMSDSYLTSGVGTPYEVCLRKVRFFRIATRLPIELQMTLAHRVFDSARTVIARDDLAFKVVLAATA